MSTILKNTENMTLFSFISEYYNLSVYGYILCQNMVIFFS
ncbi:protein of unknown function [Shewanella benthica]|uniref:Uncharacterized protein n=1 Tax=Shewanella benthica TaxID=43661 RepID=A0A330M742_9GAMM|nr:protein of unknown function [Shewanella benthica]